MATWKVLLVRNPLLRLKAQARRFKPISDFYIAKESAELLRSGLFDPEWYLSEYHDVAAAGSDPLRHFLRTGWRENRNPNPLFHTGWYASVYPDVAQSGINPVLHYIRYGAIERRDTSPLYAPTLFQHADTPRGSHHLSGALAFMRGIKRHDQRGAIPNPPHVLIIAELSIAQCKKYRVDQKAEMLDALGFSSTVVSWHDDRRFSNLLLTHSIVIFYRVPATPTILKCISKAKALGLRTIWEVDDLIFDPNVYIKNSNLDVLEPDLLRSVLSGVAPYRSALIACDEAIASTHSLAAAMRETGVKTVHVVENALDHDTITISQFIRGQPKPPSKEMRIVYGSGTNTHDMDFLEVSGALLNTLKRHPKLKFRIIGELTLPDEFDGVDGQIETFPPMPYDKYLKLLSECDIAIAPLEASAFNDAKSNIKFIEASIVDLPSICSPRSPFTSIVDHGRNGFLANSQAEWETSFELLIASASLRRKVSLEAKADIERRYRPEMVARDQLLSVVAAKLEPKPPLRVMAVNIFFSPRSFGGATVVAEQLAKRLNDRDDTQVCVFTAAPPGIAQPYDVLRYDIGGTPVFAISLPETSDPSLEFDSPYTTQSFRDVVRFVRPDVVHFHSIQGLGVRLLEVCKDEGIPIVISLHDAWWICGRQFMVTGEGSYCFQRTIDLNVCATCVADAGLNLYRQYRLSRGLDYASLLLTPSDFFTRLYQENLPQEKLVMTNKNGISPPSGYVRSPSEIIRFGFVGGNADIKGANLIKRAFSLIENSNFELILIDNMLSLGFNSVNPSDWPVSGKLTILPSYTQETMNDFYSRIDVLLFPTQWKESFGLTVREALIRDIWVVATDAGGVTEDLYDGTNGTIIPLLDDGSALREAINQLITETSKIRAHVNPHKDQITLYDDQASELHGMLCLAAATRPSVSRSKRATSPPPQASDSQIGSAAKLNHAEETVSAPSRSVD